MIKYSEEEGFIKPVGIINTSNKPVDIPKTAIGVFSKHLYEDIVEKFSSCEIGSFLSTNMERKVYKIKYKEKEFTFFMAGVGGPMIAADIDDLASVGVEKVIIFGNCGVLDKKIEDCSIIIPTKSFRDEGTSQHYVPDSETIDLNKKYKKDFIEVLKEYNFKYTEGFTWTTDAIYRETPEKIKYFKEKGAVCVEMEGATIAAVTKRNKIDHFTFYYAGDNLDAVEWDERSIKGDVNLEKKKLVTILALELAYKVCDK